MISRLARTQPQADARTEGFKCRSSISATWGGNTTPSCEAEIAATARIGPWTIPLAIISLTNREASGPSMAARASNAAACSGTLQSTPKPTKRLHKVASAVTAPLNAAFRPRRQAQASASESGRAAINAASDNPLGARDWTGGASEDLESARGQQTVRIDCAFSRSQNLSHNRARFNKFYDRRHADSHDPLTNGASAKLGARLRGNMIGPCD